jgi:hypothetical protein
MKKTAPATTTLDPTSYPEHHPAVQSCIDAWNDSMEESKAKQLEDYQCRRNAIVAYREAMPDLAGRENIQGFIACVTYGLVIEIIYAHDATKLFYAAQVAIGAVGREPKEQKKPAA